MPITSLQFRMSEINPQSYVTHLPEFRVVVCRLGCLSAIPPKDPMRHYKLNHTVRKDHPVGMDVRHKITEYMATLDLCEPGEVVTPHALVEELKVIPRGFICNSSGCGKCTTSKDSMVTHYYKAHRDQIHKGIQKNWEETSLQTFFQGQHRKYYKLNSILILDILRSDCSLIRKTQLQWMNGLEESWKKQRNGSPRPKKICTRFMMTVFFRNCLPGCEEWGG